MTKSQVRDKRWQALALLVVGLGLLFGANMAAAATIGPAEELERTGARVPGIVVQADEGGVEDLLFNPAKIVVEYTWQDRVRRERINLDDNISRVYEPGDAVTVLVDRDDPDHVSIPGEWNESPISVVLNMALLAGAVAVLIAAGATGVGAHRLRRDLGRQRWEAQGAAQTRLFFPSRPRPRHPRAAWPWVVAALSVLVVSFGADLVVEERASDLERGGARVPGVVADVLKSDDDDVFGGDGIVVDFTWQDRARRETVHVDELTSKYRAGAPVTMVVDRSDPERVSIVGETNQAPWTGLLEGFAFLGGFGLLAKGGWVWVRGRRLRRRGLVVA